MINKLKSAVLAGAAVLTVGLGATSASATTVSGTATANIVAAITITQNAGLNFGTIVPDAVGGNVVVDFANGRTCGGALTCSGTVTSGAFTATGTANQGVSITTAASTTLTSGANSMTVSGIAPNAASAVLSALGSTSFTVGGTLAVGANQAAGVYNGTYNVNVNYQ